MSERLSDLEYVRILKAYLHNKVLDTLPAPLRLKPYSKIGIVKRISPDIISGIYDINLLDSAKRYESSIERFKQILDTKLTHCNNSAFYNNIEDLTVRTIDRNTPPIDLPSTHFDAENNRITFNKLQHQNLNMTEVEQQYDLDSTFTHELLHLATTYRRGVVVSMGFQQVVPGVNFAGAGLNEGYTELINKRYFEKKTGNDIKMIYGAYEEQQIFSIGIERLIGRKKMEQLFFDADLDGLVQEMTKYTDRQTAIGLISKIDNFHFSKEKETKERLSAEIKSTLANLIQRKIDNRLNNGEITEDIHKKMSLDNALYLIGKEIFEINDSYFYGGLTSKFGYTMSPAGHQVLLNNFLYQKEDIPYTIYDTIQHERDLPSQAMFIINEERNGRDFSNIERVDFIDPSENIYRFVPKQTKKRQEMSEHTNELNEMFENCVSETIESKAQIK